jgi:hypothetical protein
MSKLADISRKPELRDYAQGSAQSTTSKVAELLAPTVPVATSVGRFKKYTEKSRFRLPETVRALGGRATEIGFSSKDEKYDCTPHALDFPIDLLEKIDAAAGDDEAVEDLLLEGADMVSAVAALQHSKEVVDLALDAAGAGAALSIGANDDVIKQIDEDILNVILAAKYGDLMGIGVVFGAGAWGVVKNHASVRGRFVAGGNQKFANASIAEFGKLLIADAKCDVTLMCFDDAAEGLPEDMKFILNGDILVFARMDSPTRRDPSFMKTFRLRNKWMVPGSYVRDDGRVEVAKYDWSQDVQVTNAAAIKRRTVAL